MRAEVNPQSSSGPVRKLADSGIGLTAFERKQHPGGDPRMLRPITADAPHERGGLSDESG
jgi:hypothetical protein